MEKQKTPLRRAWDDYVNNRYWVAGLLGLMIMAGAIYHFDEFDSIWGIIAVFGTLGLSILVPFIYVFIWASQYKKGTRK